MIPTKLAIFLIVILLYILAVWTSLIICCQVDGAKNSFRHPNNEDGQREGAPGDDAGERKDCGHQQLFDVVAFSSYVERQGARAPLGSRGPKLLLEGGKTRLLYS